MQKKRKRVKENLDVFTRWAASGNANNIAVGLLEEMNEIDFEIFVARGTWTKKI